MTAAADRKPAVGVAAPRIGFSRKKAVRLAVRYAAAVALTALFLFPIYWLFMISFKTPEEIFASPPVWYPASIQFDNFAVLFQTVTASPSRNSTAKLSNWMLAGYHTGGEAKISSGVLKEIMNSQ